MKTHGQWACITEIFSIGLGCKKETACGVGWDTTTGDKSFSLQNFGQTHCKSIEDGHLNDEMLVPHSFLGIATDRRTRILQSVTLTGPNKASVTHLSQLSLPAGDNPKDQHVVAASFVDAATRVTRPLFPAAPASHRRSGALSSH